MTERQRNLGDAVEDDYYASHGVRTGSAFNESLVVQRESAQRRPAARVFVGDGTSGSDGMFAEAFDAVDDLFDRVPPVVLKSGVALVVVAVFVASLHFGGTWFEAVCVSAVGASISVVAYSLLRVVVKLAVVAFALAIAGGVLWALIGLLQLIS